MRSSSRRVRPIRKTWNYWLLDLMGPGRPKLALGQRSDFRG
jgi:hypothetical protein